MSTPLDNNVLTERVIQLETNVANLQDSVNSAIRTMMSKLDEVLQRTNIGVAPTPNAAPATSPTAPSLSLLELAARGDSDAISRMLGDETDLSNFNRREENGDTALHIAAREGHMVTVKMLRKIVNVDDPGHLLRTPLHCAAAHGHLDVVQCLLEFGAQVDAKDARYKTPLALAAEKEHKHIVDLLTQSMLQPSNSASPLESLNSINLVRYLKDNGVPIESSNSKGNGLVLQAARSNRWVIVDFLLERGLSATECKDAEECALVLAARAGQADAVRRLLRRGAASHAEQVKWGLGEAKSAAVVWVFLEVVPDAVRGPKGEWAMIYAAWKGRLEPLAALLDLGVDINSKIIPAWTALMMAAASGHITCVKELLRRGADVDAKNNDGNTALHYAAQYGKEECARALLEVGASKTEKNNNGKTPFEMAQSESIRLLFNTFA